MPELNCGLKASKQLSLFWDNLIGAPRESRLKGASRDSKARVATQRLISCDSKARVAILRRRDYSTKKARLNNVKWRFVVKFVIICKVGFHFFIQPAHGHDFNTRCVPNCTSIVKLKVSCLIVIFSTIHKKWITTTGLNLRENLALLFFLESRFFCW